MSVWEGDIGICVWFGAPSIHRMSSRNLARQRHVVCDTRTFKEPCMGLFVQVICC